MFILSISLFHLLTFRKLSCILIHRVVPFCPPMVMYMFYCFHLKYLAYILTTYIYKIPYVHRVLYDKSSID